MVFLSLSAGVASAQPAVVKGMVSDESGQPLEQVYVTAEGGAGQTVTDAFGAFSLEIPAGKEVRVLFRQLSFKDTVLHFSLKPREAVRLGLVMRAAGARLPTVNIRSRSDDGYIHIDPKLTFQLPSAGGGIESVIKLFPGASSTNELSAQYNVRGGNFDENMVFVNDIQVYRPFLMRNAQQEGMSFVNSDLTGNVKFSAGGFEAQYGDKMSSVLDVQYKDPTSYAGSFSAGLLGASAHAEGSVDSVFSFLIGIRYKSNAYLFKSLETSGEYRPNFFDTQFLLKWKPTKKLGISLLGNVARNSYISRPDVRKSRFGTVSDAKQVTVYFDGQEVDRYENLLGGLTFDYSPGANSLLKLIVSSYYARESETYDIQGQYWLSDIELDFGDRDSSVRETNRRGVGTYVEHARNRITSAVTAADLRGRHRLPAANTLSWGVKVQNEAIHDRIREWVMTDSSGYTLPVLLDTVGVPVPLDDSVRQLVFFENDFLTSANTLNTFRITGFVQDLWKIDGDSMPKYILNAGLRWHYWTFNREFTLSPRLAFIYRPRWKHDWEFALKTGMYYQPAFYREMRRPDGSLNHDIRSQRSFQVIVCSEYNFHWWRRPFKFTAEAYGKYLDRLVSYTVDNIQIVYSGDNDAVGYAAGLDLKLSGEFIKGLESWFSVSLMKTAEKHITGRQASVAAAPPETQGYMPRPTDQTAAFNVFFQDNIPGFPQFRVHLNFVFASGLPNMTPVGPGPARIWRSSWYRRVDVGFSFMLLEQSRDRMRNKSKFIRNIKNAGIYVEAFNLLDIKNVSSYFWIRDINGCRLATPNNLTGRLLNVKFAVDF